MKKLRFGKMAASLALAASLTLSAVPFTQAPAAYAASASTQSKIVSVAKGFMGTPYQFSAPTSSTRVFDCSSFTKYVFAKVGVSLPRSSKDQSKVGSFVSRSNLKVGDLVFFYSPIHHVGIYIGNNQIIHTYGAPGVTVTSLSSSWWSKNYATARRVL
ncbi:C40 family peptidase [Paenibacillus sp. Leaf72]|uniref:C40 family peptidase n=1 Tax=Paenibacillus sp. Leaf72 TaxID=1736234 RepID=UPI0006F6076B|nr:C40 family peptidase [Paenibacillus sp. Leaf72]KQO01207.1 hydrolase [Paenibacillus sp. Leaf72]